MQTPRDTWLVFQRAVGLMVRNPVWVSSSLAQPLFYLFLFGPLLSKVAERQRLPRRRRLQRVRARPAGPAGAVRLRLRRLHAWSAELRYGVIERLRVTPVSRAALLLGRARPRRRRRCSCRRDDGAAGACRSGSTSTSARVWRSAFGLLAGDRPGVLGDLVHARARAAQRGRAGAAAQRRGACRSCCCRASCCRCRWRPTGCSAIADGNPLRHVVDATRSLVNGHVWDGDVLRGLLIMIGCAAVAVTVATRRFRRAAA